MRRPPTCARASTGWRTSSRGMRFSPLLIMAGLSIGCGGRAGDEAAYRTPEAPSGDSTTPVITLTTFAYQCADSTYVVAKFRPQDDLTLFLPSGTVRLYHQPSASGARYADSTVAFWSKGREATIEYADGRRIECLEDRRQSVIEDAKLRGADYWAVGNEPGWTLELFSDSIAFVTAYGTERYRFITPAPEVDGENHRTIYRARTAAHDLTITISYGRCRDSMSGESFEGTVELLFDGTALRGCGQALH